MAIIHLYLLGYSGEDLNNFTLTLTNPSTQEELLKSELMRDKAQTYTELTRADNGIAAMSHTKAKRLIFNMSDREIVDDLKQQKMEKVVMQELQDSPVIIKKSGLFTDIDNRFGEPIEGMPLPSETGNTGQQGGAPMNQGEMPPPMPTEQPPIEGGAGQPLAEKFNYDEYVENMIYNNKEKKDTNKIIKKSVISENSKKNHELNQNASNMISEINNLLKNNKIKNENINNDNTDELEIDINKLDLDE